MRIYKATDYNDMSRKAANIISAQIIMKPDWFFSSRNLQTVNRMVQ